MSLKEKKEKEILVELTTGQLIKRVDDQWSVDSGLKRVINEL